jgi:hypothetical protein
MQIDKIDPAKTAMILVINRGGSDARGQTAILFQRERRSPSGVTCGIGRDRQRNWCSAGSAGLNH